MQLSLPSNAYNDVTDFEIYGFPKNTKSSISQEQNIIFSSNKKHSLIAHQRLLYVKEMFCSGGNL